MFFLVWRGWGILAIPIIVMPVILIGVLPVAAMTEAGWPEWPMRIVLLASFLAAAAANWVIGRKFNRQPPRELVDPKTGQRVLLVRRHQLFFIDMEYWSIPILLFAIWGLVIVALHA